MDTKKIAELTVNMKCFEIFVKTRIVMFGEN